MTEPTSHSTPKDLVLWGWYRRVRPFLWRTRVLPRLQGLSDASFREMVGLPQGGEEINAFLEDKLRHRLFFHSRNRKDFFLNILTSLQPYDDILDEADEVLENRFEAFGSGQIALGAEIDWHTDFKSGISWPLVPSHQLDLVQPESASDVRVPWELSRFHHVWWLGKAFWLTGSQRYAEKFRILIEHWLDKNPPGFGVNWSMTMEAAIRACNWMVGYSFFSSSTFIPPEFWVRFLKSLYTHGVFIEHNLEYALPRGNHFLSNVTALISLGAFFHWAPFGQRWFKWGVDQLETEMARQVYDDGVSYEKSTQYQRFILELFYTPVLLAQRNGHTFSPQFMAHLHRMFSFLAAVQRPDGTIPQFGDSDDGRLFRVRKSDNPNDVRHAMSIGSLLFEDPSLQHGAGGFHHECLWLTGAEGFEKERMIGGQVPPRKSEAFAAGGFFVLQSPAAHIVVDAGDIGMEGKGGHGHNDTLSFEYWADGHPLILDPGTFAYTSDEGMRNHFRSVLSHNTVMVDEQEPATFAGLWRIEEDRTDPRVVRWSSDGDADILIATHEGYSRLSDPVRHTRTFEFDKPSGKLIVTDELHGKMEHLLVASLHLHPAVEVESKDNMGYILRREGSRYRVGIPDGMSSVQDGWYSPSYGVKVKTTVLRIRRRAPLPYIIRTTIERLPA